MLGASATQLRAGGKFLMSAMPENQLHSWRLADSKNLMTQAPWLMIFPGLTIMLGILGFNLLGDGLRDILDPRMRRVAP